MSEIDPVLAVKELIAMSLSEMRSKCPRVMGVSVVGIEFKQSNVSLSYHDIRDIIRARPLVFKELIEECLLAKQMLITLWESISSLYDDYHVHGEDTLSIFNEAISAAEFKSCFHFPFHLKQKLLVTACKHPSKKLFGPLLMPAAVDSFAVGGDVYPTVFDKLYVEEELQSISTNTIRGNVFESLISPDVCISPGSDSEGLSIDDYLTHVHDDYMRACGVASHLLQEKVFSKLGKVHVKSLSGMKEKILYREKLVNDMIIVTVYFEEHNLVAKMGDVKRKLSMNGLTFLKEDKSKNEFTQLSDYVHQSNIISLCEIYI